MTTPSSATADAIKRDLKKLADPEKAAFFPGFFKAGPGQYGHGDRFLGVTVPKQRKLARTCRELPARELQKLIGDPFHECRLTALLILVEKFERAKTPTDRQRWFRFYVRHFRHVNNWDLVDSSASRIAGAYCWETGNDQPLKTWLVSDDLWQNRAALVATLHYIRHDDLDRTYAFAQQVLAHPHDLIHKAAGWMLREAGKRNESSLIAFLDHHHRDMPRTMLRYAIERLPEQERKHYRKR